MTRQQTLGVVTSLIILQTILTLLACEPRSFCFFLAAIIVGTNAAYVVYLVLNKRS